MTRLSERQTISISFYSFSACSRHFYFPKIKKIYMKKRDKKKSKGIEKQPSYSINLSLPGGTLCYFQVSTRILALSTFSIVSKTFRELGLAPRHLELSKRQRQRQRGIRKELKLSLLIHKYFNKLNVN